MHILNMSNKPLTESSNSFFIVIKKPTVLSTINLAYYVLANVAIIVQLYYSKTRVKISQQLETAFQCVYAILELKKENSILIND